MPSTLSFTATFVSALLATGLAQAQPQLVRKHTYTLQQKLPTGATDLNLRDQERAAALGRHGGALPETSTTSTLSFINAAGNLQSGVSPGGRDVKMDNDFSAYLIRMGVGEPATYYTMLVDTGSANTWINATNPGSYVPTSSAEDTGRNVGMQYGINFGSFSGREYTDTVTFQGVQGNVVAEGQGIGIASSQSGFGGLGGILGLAPAVQTLNSQTDPTTGAVIKEVIPTVPDTLYAQGDIPVNSVGISFIPTTYAGRAGAGTLTFGGVNYDEFVGSIMYFPKSTYSEVVPYWGFETSSVKFDKLNGDTWTSTEFLSEPAYGIIDTGSTLISLPTSVFNEYQAQIPGSMFNNRGMFLIPESQVPLLGNMTINIAGNDFILSPSAQLFPNEISRLFGINPDDGYYLSVFGNSGFDSGDSFTLGMYFLERFYSVYDTTNQRIGLAYTEYTFDKTTELTAFRRTKRSHRVSSKKRDWIDGKTRLNKLSSRSPFADPLAQVVAKA